LAALETHDSDMRAAENAVNDHLRDKAGEAICIPEGSTPS
jgi:hypothetical protein